MRPRIICLGEAMVEERVAPDGKLTAHFGGDTLNTAIHLSRLGCDVAYATAVGRDGYSDALVAAWKAEGLDTSLVARHPSRTIGRYRITLGKDGERSFSYDRSQSAAREMFSADGFLDSVRAIEDAHCFVFSLISLAILPDESRKQLLALAATASISGKVAYDGNYRLALWESQSTARHWHEEAIKVSDIGLPTLEDEVALSEAEMTGNADGVAALWSSLGCQEVLVKAGAAGCRLPSGTMLAPPKELSPVDTSGAGDAFNAGYLTSRLVGRSPEQAAMAGHQLAGWTIMRPGAIPQADAEAPYDHLLGGELR